MTSATFQVTGLAELEKRLELLKVATGKAALRRAGLSALEPMARLARQRAPKDTGDLIESIDVAANAVGAGREIGKAEFASVMRGGGSRSDALVALRGARRGASARGAHVELFMGPTKAATKDEAIKARVQEFGSSRMAPNPFMRPAWDEDKEAMLERLKRDLWIEIETAIARSRAREAVT